MGGVDTNIEAETLLPGLYAAGECACVSINGANRLGSNSLVEILVFGARAGRNAAEWARKQPAFNRASLEAQANDEQRRIARDFINRQEGTVRVASIRVELQRAMESGCGIYRTEVSLLATMNTLADLKEQVKSVKLDDRSLSFNTELTTALELEFAIDIAEALVHSALLRTESRGSHQRSDFPKRDDAQFLKHSLAYRGDGAPRIDYRDVVITKWPPEERVYGRAH
jgi:fumarate reductase flavoprotein subunit